LVHQCGIILEFQRAEVLDYENTTVKDICDILTVALVGLLVFFDDLFEYVNLLCNPLVVL
jgi:hypothetical protein